MSREGCAHTWSAEIPVPVTGARYPTVGRVGQQSIKRCFIHHASKGASAPPHRCFIKRWRWYTRLASAVALLYGGQLCNGYLSRARKRLAEFYDGRDQAFRAHEFHCIALPRNWFDVLAHLSGMHMRDAGWMCLCAWVFGSSWRFGA